MDELMPSAQFALAAIFTSKFFNSHRIRFSYVPITTMTGKQREANAVCAARRKRVHPL